MSLSRVVAYVTGAGQGLGRATALRLASQGARVVVADINEAHAKAVAEEIGAQSAMAVTVDVTSEDDVSVCGLLFLHTCEIINVMSVYVQVKASLDAAVAKWGKVNTAVNCAGIAIAVKTLSKRGPHDLGKFSKVLQVNAAGTFNVVRLAAEKMAQNEADEDGIRGVIVNTASIAAMDGQMGQAAYAASKGAVVSMTLPIARDLSSHGIRVNCVAPGLFLTPMLESLPEAVRTQLGQTVPLPKRLGKPAEYAKLVQSIVENPMLNGEVIRLDGALRMQP